MEEKEETHVYPLKYFVPEKQEDAYDRGITLRDHIASELYLKTINVIGGNSYVLPPEVAFLCLKRADIFIKEREKHNANTN